MFVVYPVPTAIEAQLSRWESIAGIVLQTAFGGLIGGLAISAAAETESGIRSLIVAAAIVSGASAALAVDALRVEPTVVNVLPELARKGRRTHDALHLLGVAALLAVVAAGLVLD